jgi:hypothetical protein
VRTLLALAFVLAITFGARSASADDAAACSPPVLTEYPPEVAATAGHPFFLCYFYAGTPGSTQWYSGRKGDTSHPIAGAVAQCLVTAVYGNVEFWVRLTNECGVADSETIRVIVKSKPRVAGH